MSQRAENNIDKMAGGGCIPCCGRMFIPPCLGL